MDINRPALAFEDYLKGKGLTEESLSLQSFPALFVDYYGSVRFEEVHGVADGDMLLFQYGEYDREDSRFFKVDFTRQFYEVFSDDDEQISQQHFTFFFDPSGLDQLGAYNTWSCNWTDINDFQQAIVSSKGFLAALDRPLVKRQFTVELV